MNLRREVSKTLRDRGFVKMNESGGGRVHLQRIDAEFAYVVDIGPIGSRTDIAPFVGFRHDTVERVYGELCDLPDAPYVATVIANVGYVLGREYGAWEPPDPAETVTEAILKGLRRLEPFLDLARVPDAWDAIPVAAANPATGYQRVVVQLLLNNVPGVLAALEMAERQYCTHDDEIAATFRRFKARVLERLEIVTA